MSGSYVSRVCLHCLDMMSNKVLSMRHWTETSDGLPLAKSARMKACNLLVIRSSSMHSFARSELRLMVSVEISLWTDNSTFGTKVCAKGGHFTLRQIEETRSRTG